LPTPPFLALLEEARSGAATALMLVALMRAGSVRPAISSVCCWSAGPGWSVSSRGHLPLPSRQLCVVPSGRRCVMGRA